MEKVSLRRGRFGGLVVAVLLASSSVGAEGPRSTPRAGKAIAGPTNDAPHEARARYERAVQLYGEGNAEAALAEFERAYQLAPTYRLLYNIGLLGSQLNDYAQALKAFQQYLVEGGSEIAPARRAEVEQHVAGLRNKVGAVQVISTATLADVSVDDDVVGRVPLSEPIVVNPGRRRITISKGGASRSRVVTVVGQDMVRLELNLEPSSLPSPTTAAPQPARTAIYATWGVTTALGVSAAVAGVLAFRAMKDLDDLRERAPTSRAELDNASSKMRTLALATDILTGATVLVGSVAIYLTLRAPSREAPRAQLPLRVGVGPSGLRLDGQF
jgi:hypothetical protein